MVRPARPTPRGRGCGELAASVDDSRARSNIHTNGRSVPSLGMGHTAPSSGRASAGQFIEDHPFGVKPEPYAAALPQGGITTEARRHGEQSIQSSVSP